MAKEKSMYDIIKRQNGEVFARAIRDLDPRIFDVENLPQILRYAGRNPAPLMRVLNSLMTEEKSLKADTKDPFVLLKRAGYNAFYADTLEKQNSILPYFTKREELCTFKDASRYKNYYIVHCVKEGAENLVRSEYDNKEKREDIYGRSVISIQILKTGGFIKITNRYNHTVDGCDNTFNSNPDNIIPGLSQALKSYFNVDFTVKNAPLPNGYLYQSGVIIHYDTEINNCYIGRDFYFKDGKVFPIDKNSQMMIDEFIIDLKEKRILNPARSTSPLYDVLLTESRGDVWQILKRLNRYVFYIDKKEVLEIKDGHLATLYLRKTATLSNFLSQHKYIESLYGYSVLSLGKNSLSHTPCLHYVLLPRCELLGKNCFENTGAFIEAPLLKRQGLHFMAGTGIDVVNKKLISRGKMPYQIYDFLKRNMHVITHMTVTELSNAVIVHADNKPFLYFKDDKFVGLYLPAGIKVIEPSVLMDLSDLREVTGEGVHLIEDGNLLRCNKLEKAEFFNLKYLGCNCISSCPCLTELLLPELVKMPGCTSLCNDSSLRYVYAPNLYIVPDFNFLPALERFDCAMGVYIRQTPQHLKRSYFSNKFVFVKRGENERG